jgi:hypothetical protein
MTHKEAILDIVNDLELHPADFIPTWIEIRGEIEKLRLIVAAYDGGDYTEDQMLDHSNNVMEDIRDFLLMENSIDNLNTLRQSMLN